MSTRVKNSKIHMIVHSCHHKDAYELRHNSYVFLSVTTCMLTLVLTRTRLGLDVDQ